MPGARLTKQERQQIALGLADDLAYAEIARRLGRPTSTVTREVMRNGGSGAYRADVAQHATERRARRGSADPAVHRAPHQADDAALRDCRETFVALMMQQGLTRTAAGVLTCLYTSNVESLTAAELVDLLDVSPGAISRAIALLEVHGLVRREPGEGRRERYLADGDVWYRALLAAAETNLRLADASHEGAHLLGDDTLAGRRLAGMAQFMDFVAGNLLRSVAEARALFGGDGADVAGRPGPDPVG